eukprot:scaffold22056_cov113-Isochrysis_galbana.AAC.11
MAETAASKTTNLARNAVGQAPLAGGRDGTRLDHPIEGAHTQHFERTDGDARGDDGSEAGERLDLQRVQRRRVPHHAIELAAQKLVCAKADAAQQKAEQKGDVHAGVERTYPALGPQPLEPAPELRVLCRP